MATPFIGEIRLVGFNFAPIGWAECNGQLLSINDHDALFNLIGTTYGGDGQTTFALPDYRGRVAISQSSSFVIGQTGGVESVTLTPAHLPTHSHSMAASSAPGNSKSPQDKVYAQIPNATKSDKLYGAPKDQQASNQMVSIVGGSQPHENRQPFLALKYIIALEGIFPQP
jgi:microcystin-dependent protein